ncbi:MAG: alcohol dehydrogenase catalytic domain-containing protein [Bacteroidia bacterium]
MIKELTLLRKNKLAWREKDEPRITNPHEAIIRPFVASRCDGDSIFLFHNYSNAIRLGAHIHFLDKKVIDVFGKNPLQPPFCVGHECIGEVVETGDEVSSFKKGQVVIVPWAISCGVCNNCSSGFYSNCSDTGSNTLLSAYGFGQSMGDWGGCVSDLLKVPFADKMLIELPENINPYHCSSLSDNIADAYRTVGPQLKKNPNVPVLILGGAAKSIGLYAASLAIALGASRVDYLDDDVARLQIAESVGANPVDMKGKVSIDRFSASLLKTGYPIVVDASGSIKKLNFGIRNLSPGGICTSTAFYLRKETPLPLWEMFIKSATLHVGISHPRRDIPEILPLISSGSFKPEKIISLTANWSDATEAYLENTTKLILRREPVFDENKKRYQFY